MMLAAAASAGLRAMAVPLLAAPPTPPPGKGPEWGKAAPVGLLVIVLLCLAFWLLVRNMNKHLRGVRERADLQTTAADPRDGAPVEQPDGPHEADSPATRATDPPADAAPGAAGDEVVRDGSSARPERSTDLQ